MLEKALPRRGGEDLSGLYHYCDGGVVSWHDFALVIFNAAKKAGLLRKMPEVTAVGSDGFPQKAKRPKYSVLDVSATLSAFGIERPGLEESVRSCLEDLINEQG
jgi:dTDP-4-dehydrorhamnose reductase